MRVAVVDATVTRPLRLAVLRPAWPADATMPGDSLPGTVHLAAYAGDEVVGACLVLPAVYPERPGALGAWQLRGMATAPGRRGQGIGGAVLSAAVALVAERDAALLWCGARRPAVAFYERYGFAVEGDEYVQSETGLPHVHMWRAVHGVPPELPEGVETVPISDDGFTVSLDADGAWRMVSHPGIKRDARRLLAALGEVQRDLQGTMDGQWSLALRPGLGVLVQRDLEGFDAIGTIEPGLEPSGLAPDALAPERMEHTLTADALDQVAQATHWLLYSQSIHWPRCADHPSARVQPRRGVWICRHDEHELAPVGQLSPPRRRRRLRPDGTAEHVDDERTDRC